MQYAYPNYYPRFQCTAGACTHNCCIGWEIDIDKATLKKYRSVRGELGKQLRKSISRGKAPHFRLTDGEKCPFLNDNKLCALILHGGEEMLCQICRDHPRFRSYLPGRTEIGLGLCCEEAARLILSQTEKAVLIEDGEAENGSEEAAALLRFRDVLFLLAQDRTMPVRVREEALLARCGVSLPDYSPQAFAALYLPLERMDERWTNLLTALQGFHGGVEAPDFAAHMLPRETEYENLLFYFLYRHITAAAEGTDIGALVKFCVLSVRMLRMLGAAQYAENHSFTLQDQIELVRLYSAEIEYSDKNRSALFPHSHNT